MYICIYVNIMPYPCSTSCGEIGKILHIILDNILTFKNNGFFTNIKNIHYYKGDHIIINIKDSIHYKILTKEISFDLYNKYITLTGQKEHSCEIYKHLIDNFK